jgi:hypothetical protein
MKILTDEHGNPYVWQWTYPVGKLAEELAVPFSFDVPMPSIPGLHEAEYNGRRVIVVVGYKCPVALSCRLAYADDSTVDIRDVKTWSSTMYHE